MTRAYIRAQCAAAPTKRLAAWGLFIVWGEVMLRTVGLS